MTAISKAAGRKDRPNTPRDATRPAALPEDRAAPHDDASPSAGAHAADHLINYDATPGSGALPSRSHNSGKEVDGAAG